jgi:DNA-binding PadR family transcriptional regulator
VSINNVVLGILIERPCHGYELVKQVQQRLGKGEIATANVYAALQTVERSGLAEALDPASAGDGRRASPLSYRATERGVEHFEQWIEQEHKPGVRDTLRLKFLVAQARHMPRLLELARIEEQRCRRCLDTARRHAPAAPAAADERRWSSRKAAIANEVDASYWESRLSWLASLHRLFGNGISQASMPRA